jgi:hypothetical protein
LLYGVVWFVIASMLLHTTWNRVVVALTGAKQAQLWHAFLVVFTLAVLCAPHHWAQMGGCGAKSCCKWQTRGAAVELPMAQPLPSPPVPAQPQ